MRCVIGAWFEKLHVLSDCMGLVVQELAPHIPSKQLETRQNRGLSDKEHDNSGWKRRANVNYGILLQGLFETSRLVGSGSRLASLELVKVPATDGQVALVLVHAAAEVVDVGLADLGGLVAGRGVGAVVCRVGGSLALLLNRSRRAATEEAANGVADGRADCDTTIVKLSVWGPEKFGQSLRDKTHAAVLAIWPKRPGPALCWGAAAAGGGACCC